MYDIRRGESRRRYATFAWLRGTITIQPQFRFLILILLRPQTGERRARALSSALSSGVVGKRARELLRLSVLEARGLKVCHRKDCRALGALEVVHAVVVLGSLW